MWLKLETKNIQTEMASYCRNGEMPEIPGAVKERLPHYRRLVYNVVSDTLETAFPILNSRISEDVWKDMVHDFFSHHKCSTPLLWQLPYEFYAYAKAKSYAVKYHLPWLIDLLYFEWLEVELFMMEDKAYPDFKRKGDLFNDPLAVNPECRLVKFDYPVHSKEMMHADQEKGTYYILLFRDKESGSVQFISLSILFAMLVESLIHNKVPLRKIVKEAASYFDIGDAQQLNKNTTKFITDLQVKGFVLGFLNK